MKRDPDKRPLSDEVDETEIPTLNETVEEAADNSAAPEDITTLPIDDAIADEGFREREIATLEAIVFDGASPKQATPSKHRATGHTETPNEQPQPKNKPSPEQAIPAGTGALTAKGSKPLPQTSSNPFLPQHILDRLNHGRRNLVEEIAQSGAALDASTAMIRARSRHEHSPQAPSRDRSTGVQEDDQLRKSSAKQKQLIDELVEEYLPLLAAELRKRLKAELDKEIGRHSA